MLRLVIISRWQVVYYRLAVVGGIKRIIVCYKPLPPLVQLVAMWNRLYGQVGGITATQKLVAVYKWVTFHTIKCHGIRTLMRKSGWETHKKEVRLRKKEIYGQNRLPNKTRHHCLKLYSGICLSSYCCPILLVLLLTLAHLFKSHVLLLYSSLQAITKYPAV